MPETPVHQAQQVVVQKVWGEPEPYHGKRGVTLEYKLTLEDGRFATINQKPETSAPFPGQHIEADMQLLKEGGKMWRLFNVKRDKGATFDYSQPPSQPALQPVGRYEVQDITQRLIIRQNALNRALECAVAMNRLAPELSISETAVVWVDFFEQLIWEAASKGHELKVLEWAGVMDAPAGGEGTSEGHPPPSGVTETSLPAGAVPDEAPEREAGPPGGPPGEGGDVSKASPATLVQIQRARREHNVPALVFSTFLTSLGVEDISHLSEDDAQVVLAWIANGDGQVAA